MYIQLYLNICRLKRIIPNSNQLSPLNFINNPSQSRFHLPCGWDSSTFAGAGGASAAPVATCSCSCPPGRMCSTLATAAVSRSCSATWRSFSGSTVFGLGKLVFHWSKSIRNPQGFSGEMKHFGYSKFVTPGTDDEHQDLKDYESSKTEKP